jgi:hypothetical protein
MLSFNLTGYYTLMNDAVNNPTHYNQNGIEVIDVIETYAKGDFRLANVIKYVCRCEYKGRKLQDLQKAAWYLDRVIEELLEEPHGYTDRECEVFWDGYRCKEQELDELTCPYTGKGCTVRALDEERDGPETGTLVHPSPDRIAGDNEAAQRIKSDYYGFDRHEIKGYCANCDREIGATQPHITGGGFEEGIFFCKPECLNLLREWQGR